MRVLTVVLLVALASFGAPFPRSVAAVPTTLELAAASPDFRGSEAVFLSGRALADGVAVSGARVEVLARTASGSWRVVTTATTGTGGRFNLTHRPLSTTYYQARIAGGISSGAVRAAKTTRARTLPDRRTALRAWTGAASGGVRTLSRYGVRLLAQRFEKAVLVQIGHSTPVIRGQMLTVYRQRGGLTGRLGAPVADITCQLMEGACVQRFQNGAIYLNDHARTKVSVAYGRSRATPIIAAALSQRGYQEPYYRGSKYGKWQGSTQAWCGIFLAWSSHASGLRNAIPAADEFPTMVSKVRRSARLHRTPRVGRMAFFGSRPHHVGLIVEVRASTIVTIEGNVDRYGGSGFPRGVHKIVHSKRSVNFYADPIY